MRLGGTMRILFIWLALLFLADARWTALPYKPLLNKSVTLDFVRVINNRFPSMNEKQIEIYLQEARKITKEHFGIDVIFKRKPDISLEKLFASLSEKIRHEIKILTYDFKHNKGNKKHLRENLKQTLQQDLSYISLDDMITYARPYLKTKLSQYTLDAFVETLIDTEIIRLHAWQKVKAIDGKPVIDENNYNEWGYWDNLGYVNDGFDVILTNQLIASSEYYGQDIHSALRGGIVAGTTSYRKSSPYDSFIFATSFVFINDDPLITELRGDNHYQEEEAAKYSGAYLAHEIGHMLLRLSHPFNRDSCVMSPAKLLRFKDWYHNIDAKECSLNSDKSMTPGSVILFYDDLLTN